MKREIRDGEDLSSLLKKYLWAGKASNMTRLLTEGEKYLKKEGLTLWEKEGAALIFRDRGEFTEVYYALFGGKIPKEALPSGVLLLDDIHRAVPSGEMEEFQKLGFRPYLTRKKERLLLKDWEEEDVALAYGRQEDLREILSLEKEALDPYTSILLSEEELQQELKGGHVLVKRVEEKLGGYLYFTESKATLSLDAVVVARKFRGQGFGKELVRGLLTLGRERKMRQTELWVREDNPRAKALYRSLGFKPRGTVVDHYIRR